MDENQHFKFTPSVWIVPSFMLLLLWAVFFVEQKLHLDFGVHGIYPRTLSGMQGIVLSPFIHGDIRHLASNSIPLFVLSAALIYFYRNLSLKILWYGILLSGAITWLIGRESFHIGASGLIYVLVAFIFFKGVMTKYYRLMALSMAVVLVYGGMIWYVFPDVDKTISWEGHLGGLLAGFIFAVRFKTPDYSAGLQYDWQKPDFDPAQDKFLQRFDAKGNFVNLPPPEPEEIPETVENLQPYNINYIYKPENKSE